MDELRRIAVVEDELHQIKSRLDPFVARISALEKETQELKNACEERTAAWNALRKKIASGEENLRYLEDRKVREAAKLDAVSSVKAAEALQNELTSIGGRIGEQEEALLLLMDEEGRLSRESSEAREKSIDAEKRLTREEELFVEARSRASERRELLCAEKAELAGRLPAEWKKKFDAVAILSRPVAIAVEDTCPGCRMKLKPNALSRLQSGSPALCDCRRILIR